MTINENTRVYYKRESKAMPKLYPTSVVLTTIKQIFDVHKLDELTLDEKEAFMNSLEGNDFVEIPNKIEQSPMDLQYIKLAENIDRLLDVMKIFISLVEAFGDDSKPIPADWNNKLTSIFYKYKYSRSDSFELALFHSIGLLFDKMITHKRNWKELYKIEKEGPFHTEFQEQGPYRDMANEMDEMLYIFDDINSNLVEFVHNLNQDDSVNDERVIYYSNLNLSVFCEIIPWIQTMWMKLLSIFGKRAQFYIEDLEYDLDEYFYKWRNNEIKFEALRIGLSDFKRYTSFICNDNVATNLFDIIDETE